MSGSRWVIIPSWLSGLWRSLLYSSSAPPHGIRITLWCIYLSSSVRTKGPSQVENGNFRISISMWTTDWLVPEKWKCHLLSCVRLFATPWTVACQVPPSMEFSRQEYWTGLPFSSPGDLPNPVIKLRSPTLQADSLPSEPSGNPFPLILTGWISLQPKELSRVFSN